MHHGIGHLHLATGRLAEASASHRTALALAIELGQPKDQARAYDGLARALYGLGQRAEAGRHWLMALDILTSGSEQTLEPDVSVESIRAPLAQMEV